MQVGRFQIYSFTFKINYMSTVKALVMISPFLGANATPDSYAVEVISCPNATNMEGAVIVTNKIGLSGFVGTGQQFVKIKFLGMRMVQTRNEGIQERPQYRIYCGKTDDETYETLSAQNFANAEALVNPGVVSIVPPPRRRNVVDNAGGPTPPPRRTAAQVLAEASTMSDPTTFLEAAFAEGIITEQQMLDAMPVVQD